MVRAIPLSMAKGLGSLAADMRWFPPAYIFFVFGLLPLLLLALSLAHWAALVFVGLPIIMALIVVSCVFGLRAYRPQALPDALKADCGILPPSMRMAQAEGAADEQAASGAGNADIESPRRWWFAPVGYGLGWYALLALWMSLPNAKWADLKFDKLDQREHIGIGGWSACG